MIFKILIVENEMNLLETLRDNLRQPGYRIESVQDWESAMELAHHFHPDLIVLNTMLPGLNQLDLNRQMELELQPAPIYFWSAQDHEIETGARPEMDGNGHSVPFNTHELPAHIQAHFRSAQILQMLQEDIIESGVNTFH